MANFHHIAFGFLGGKEVQAAGLGSLGLRDRKPPYNFPSGILTPCRSLALRWVQKIRYLLSDSPIQSGKEINMFQALVPSTKVTSRRSMTSQDLLIGWGQTHSVGDMFDSCLQRTDSTDVCISSQLCVCLQPQGPHQWLSFWFHPVPIVQLSLAAVLPSLTPIVDLRGPEHAHLHK